MHDVGTNYRTKRTNALIVQTGLNMGLQLVLHIVDSPAPATGAAPAYEDGGLYFGSSNLLK